MERYKKECEQLRELAFQQLNLIKNMDKGCFTTISFGECMNLLKDEVDELDNEFTKIISDNAIAHWEAFEQKEIKEIDFDRVFEEIGDVAAILVGLIAKANSIKKDGK